MGHNLPQAQWDGFRLIEVEVKLGEPRKRVCDVSHANGETPNVKSRATLCEDGFGSSQKEGDYGRMEKY